MKKYIILLILLSCTREYSREGQYQPTIRTTPNELIFNYRILVAENWQVKKLYFGVKTKHWPGHYWLFDSLAVDSSVFFSGYIGSIDLKKYLDMTTYQIGDTFHAMSQIRWRYLPPEQLNDTTLIY